MRGYRTIGYRREMKQFTMDFLEDEEQALTLPDDEALQEWRQNKAEARKRFVAMQALPYEVKVRRAEQRVHEFIREMDARGCEAHELIDGYELPTYLLEQVQNCNAQMAMSM